MLVTECSDYSLVDDNEPYSAFIWSAFKSTKCFFMLSFGDHAFFMLKCFDMFLDMFAFLFLGKGRC